MTPSPLSLTCRHLTVDPPSPPPLRPPRDPPGPPRPGPTVRWTVAQERSRARAVQRRRLREDRRRKVEETKTVIDIALVTNEKQKTKMQTIKADITVNFMYI